MLCGAGLKRAVTGGFAAGCPWRVAPRCREGEARRSKHCSEGAIATERSAWFETPKASRHRQKSSISG